MNSEIPNLTIVQGSGSKSFAEITSRTAPTKDHPFYGHVRQDMWVEAQRGESLYWQTLAVATLGAIQYALEHPERMVHLTKYTYDH